MGLSKLIMLFWVLLPLSAIAKLKVVATLPDYGAMIRSVGGEFVDVQVLASPLQDPHYVDARPSFILALNRADLLVLNGLELETGWLPSLVVQSRNIAIQSNQRGRLDVGSQVEDLLEVPQGKLDRSMGDVHGMGNPHVYHDPRRMRAVMVLIAQKLIELDPAHQAQYQVNLAAELSKFDALLASIRKRFDALPLERKSVVTYHRSLSYLLETLGLRLLNTLEPKPGVPPTPAHLGSLFSLLSKTGPRIMIQESYYPRKASETLSRMSGMKLVLIPGGSRENESYLAHVKGNVDAIYAALFAL